VVLHNIVTCSRPKCWPRSPLLNLRDQERYSTASPESLTVWRGSISFLYSAHYTPPPLREASYWTLTWVFSGCLAQERYQPCVTTTLSIRTQPRLNTSFFPYDIHRCRRMIPRPYMNVSPRAHKTRPVEGFPPNTRITTLPPFLTCSGHPSRRWPRLLQLNLCDQERHSAALSEKLTL
jgi:hypothetical protein